MNMNWIYEWANQFGAKVTPHNDCYLVECDEFSAVMPESYNGDTNIAIFRYGAGGFDSDTRGNTIPNYDGAINYALNNNLNQFTIFLSFRYTFKYFS